jgi:hypothetical protein
MGWEQQAAVVFDIDDLDALTTLMASTPPEPAAQAEARWVIQLGTALQRDSRVNSSRGFP